MWVESHAMGKSSFLWKMPHLAALSSVCPELSSQLRWTVSWGDIKRTPRNFAAQPRAPCLCGYTPRARWSVDVVQRAKCKYSHPGWGVGRRKQVDRQSDQCCPFSHTSPRAFWIITNTDDWAVFSISSFNWGQRKIQRHLQVTVGTGLK